MPLLREASAWAPSRSIEICKDLRGATHDLGELLHGIVLQACLNAETVAQRCCQKPRPGGRSDQGELRQLQCDDARSGALADGDRQAPVLHRGVEGLLQGARQPVDLIDEEHAPRLKSSQKRRDVSLALEGRPGGLHEGHIQLGGDDLGERGLAQAGRTGEQQMVERLAAGRGGLDRHGQLLAQDRLPDEVLERARAQRTIQLVLGGEVGSLDALGWAGDVLRGSLDAFGLGHLDARFTRHAARFAALARSAPRGSRP